MFMRARFLWVFIVALAVATLSAIAALSMPNLGSLSWDIFGSSLSLAGYMLGAMLCAIVVERRGRRVLMAFAIAAFAVSLLGVWSLIWFNPWYDFWFPFSSNKEQHVREVIGKSVATVTFGALVLLIIGLLDIMKPYSAAVRTVRVITATVVSLLAVMSSLIIWEAFEAWWLFPSDMTPRIWSGLFILSLAGLLGTPALRAAEIARRKSDARIGLPAKIKVQLTCPRCEHGQAISTGGAVCAACGLSIHVQVEEPQCSACGYSLARLDVATCPECGSRATGRG